MVEDRLGRPARQGRSRAARAARLGPGRV